MQNTTDVWIQADPDTVFDLFIQPELFPRWITGFVELRPQRGRPTQQGSVFEMVYRELGRRVVMQETIHERQDGKVYAGESWNKDVHIRFRYTFQQQGQGTLMQLHTHINLKNVAARALGGAILQTMRRHQRNNLQRLKGLVEKEANSARAS